MIKRSVVLFTHATSVALEREFWTVLEQRAREKDLSLSALIQQIDAKRSPKMSLASALRVWVLESFMTSPKQN